MLNTYNILNVAFVLLIHTRVLQKPYWLYCSEPPCGQLNIANPAIYEVLGQIYKDIVDIFSPMDLMHFGGDEVRVKKVF